jgi:geranylgeranyl pyrophosphate synthase
LRIAIEAALEQPDSAELAAIAHRVRSTGALAATRRLAEDHASHAITALDELPSGDARNALETVALASLERQA